MPSLGNFEAALSRFHIPTAAQTSRIAPPLPLPKQTTAIASHRTMSIAQLEALMQTHDTDSLDTDSADSSGLARDDEAELEEGELPGFLGQHLALHRDAELTISLPTNVHAGGLIHSSSSSSSAFSAAAAVNAASAPAPTVLSTSSASSSSAVNASVIRVALSNDVEPVWMYLCELNQSLNRHWWPLLREFELTLTRLDWSVTLDNDAASSASISIHSTDPTALESQEHERLQLLTEVNERFLWR